MTDRRLHTLLTFPSATHPREDGNEEESTLDARPASTADEPLARTLATWTVPRPSAESSERLLACIRVELGRRAQMAARRDQLRLTLPDRARQRWPLVAMASALVLAITASFWWGTVTVSADEALSQAQHAEARQWLSTSQPIVHQRIELRSVTSGARHQVEWESWSDAAGKVHRVGAMPAGQQFVVTRYLETLAHNGLDKGPPLSAVAFARWREQLPAGTDKKERVERVQTTDMGPALRILVHAPTPQMPGRIVNASVLLRTSDWHPIEQVLHVQTSDGQVERFDLIEHHVNVISGEQQPEHSVDAARPVSSKDVGSASSNSVLSVAALDEIEIQALFALHQLHADLGEQIDVIRRPQHIEIRGVAETADRIAAITGVMSQIPHTRLSLVQANRAMSARGPRQSVALSSPSTSDRRVSVEAAGDPPLWRFVDAYLRSGHSATETTAGDATTRARAVNVFVQEVNSEAEAAVAEAWALRRLTDRYPPATRAELAEPSRRRLQEMTHDYLASIRGRIVRLRRSLDAVAVAARSGRGNDVVRESEAPSTREERAGGTGSQVFIEVIDVERQLSELLFDGHATSAEADDTVLRKLARLLSFLTRLEHDLQQLVEQA